MPVRSPERAPAAVGPVRPAAEAPPQLSRAEFAEISRFAREHFGLDLKAGKEELVSARLSKRIRQGGYASFGEYLAAATSEGTGESLLELINALTTNHTSFLREPAHFDLLKKLVETEFAGIPVLRVWSAACSTGEEPYTIAGCLAAAGRSPRTWEMRATDISTRVLDAARRGVYPAAAAAALPMEWVRAVFLRGQGRSEGWYRVRGEIAGRIRFERLNLIAAEPVEAGWHVIFCRNAMIYFDKPTQQQVVRRLAGALAPGGYLLVGHSESLAGVDHDLDYVQPATYRKPAGPAAGRRARC